MKNYNVKLKTGFYLFVVVFSFSILLFNFPTAHGAELFFKPKTQETAVNQQFQVDVFLNTENENINAIEGEIFFPETFLKLKEIRDGNSVINFWIEQPRERQETRDKGKGEIVFSGITPGGYFGGNGLIFSVIFEAQEEGRGFIEFRDVKALLNDGQGTPTEIKISTSNSILRTSDVLILATSDVRR
ncbi:MAG: cohesin domain-containing protein [Patescibacteria group bacterium]